MEKAHSSQEMSELKKFYEELDDKEHDFFDITEPSPENINPPSIKSKVNPKRISHFKCKFLEM